jgi:hypothetical protein
MGPIDYSLNIANPLQSVLQGFQFGRQMRQDQEAQQAAKQKREAMASLMRPGVTFTDFQRVMQMYPEEAKGLTEQFSAMDKVAKETMFSAGADAFSLIREGADGKIDAAPAVAKLEEYALASENNGDKPGAQKFRDMASYVKANPEAGRATIGTVLSVWDPERFKNITAAQFGPLDTATIKNIVAEGNPFGSEKFKQRMREEQRKITTTLPGGGFFSGQPEELQAILGGNSLPADAQYGDLPRPASNAEFDKLKPGTVFIAPDGKLRTKPGGPASAPGGFRVGS